MSCRSKKAVQACYANGGSTVLGVRPIIPNEVLEIARQVAGMSFKSPQPTTMRSKNLEIPGGANHIVFMLTATGCNARIVAESGRSVKSLSGNGRTEQEAFEDLQARAVRLAEICSKPLELSDVISVASSTKIRVGTQKSRVYSGSAASVGDMLINSGFTQLKNYGYDHHRIVNPLNDDFVRLETGSPLHNYLRVALAMQERHGVLETREDVEWALLHGRTVSTEKLMQFPDLLAKYGMDCA